jgi:hypothetical protein
LNYDLHIITKLVERLQCYRGVNEDKAIGRFDESLQRLYMEFSKGQNTNGMAESWRELQANLKGRNFFRPGPLMRALECEKPCALLIDELDKVDEGFEAQAFKRSVSCYGLGRYLYNLAQMWVPLNGHWQPFEFPSLPQLALPKAGGPVKNHPASGPHPTSMERGPIDQRITGKIEGFRRILGDPIYGEILWRVARTRKANAIPNAQLQTIVGGRQRRAKCTVKYDYVVHLGKRLFGSSNGIHAVETTYPSFQSVVAVSGAQMPENGGGDTFHQSQGGGREVGPRDRKTEMTRGIALPRVFCVAISIFSDSQRSFPRK